MRTANPALSQEIFSNERRTGYNSIQESMTMAGTVYKTALLLLCVVLSATWTWVSFYKAGQNANVITPWMMGGAIGGLIVALITTFKKEWAAFTAPIYALLEGLFIGGISAILEASYPGIALQAVALTFGTCAVMLFAYQSGLIRVTQTFRLGVVAATGGIAIFYLIAMVLSFMGIQIPGLFGNGLIGILFSLFVVAVASANLVLDFDFIEQGSRMALPKYMEWYSAFALMVTLVWLYIEFLRLLSKMRDR